MTPQGSSWRSLAVVAVLLLGFPNPISCQTSAQQAGQADDLGSASRGEAFFSGTARFRNGGPPCADCHNAAGLPFPGGGSLGPDLTRISAKLGPLGIDPTLRTLFFPAMTAVYDPHPLTFDERADLKAFFRHEVSGPAARPTTPLILILALGGMVIFLILTWFFGRGRLTSVRKRLLKRAAGAGVIHP